MAMYTIKGETLEAIANEVRRLARLEETLSPEEMRVALSKLSLELWAYKSKNALYINRADVLVQNGSTLEVGWNEPD